jgi:hypothetical protein
MFHYNFTFTPISLPVSEFLNYRWSHTLRMEFYFSIIWIDIGLKFNIGIGSDVTFLVPPPSKLECLREEL